MKLFKKIMTVVIFLALIIGCVFYMNRNTIDYSLAHNLFLEDTCYNYYYNQLDKRTKKVYERLYYAFYNRYELIELTNVTREKIDLAYKSVTYDHPELYYVNKTYHYVDIFNIYELKLTYNYSEEQCENYNTQLSSIVELLKEKTSTYNTIEKAKACYDYVVLNTVYKKRTNDQDMISALIDKESVCAGYARAYQYLLTQLGIDVAYIQGTAKEAVNSGDDLGHAWLMLHILDDYYYSDVTWADVTTDGFEHTCYSTFLLTDTQMTSLYTPESDYEKTQTTSFDYYKTIHCYMDGYNESVLSYALRYTILQGKDIVEIKCKDASTYNVLLYKLKNTQILYELLYKNGRSYTKASYIGRESLNVIEVHFYN